MKTYIGHGFLLLGRNLLIYLFALGLVIKSLFMQFNKQERGSLS